LVTLISLQMSTSMTVW